MSFPALNYQYIQRALAILVAVIDSCSRPQTVSVTEDFRHKWHPGQRIIVVWEGGMALGNLAKLDDSLIHLYNAEIVSPISQTVSIVNIRLKEILAIGLVTPG